MSPYLSTLAQATLPELDALRQYRDALISGRAFADWQSLWASFTSFLHDLWTSGAVSDWRQGWMLVFSDRFLVVYFAPLLLLLLLLPQRHLRSGIIVTGLLFMTYVFGAMYPLIWLAQCVIFYKLSEQFSIEVKRKDVLRWAPPTQRSLTKFLAFSTFAPTMIAGPIERYREFNHEIDHCHANRNWREMTYGLFRIALGLGKHLFNIVVFAPLVYGWVLNSGYYSHPENIRSYWALLISIQLQVFCLYLNFSGYSDVAIGMGRVMGYRVIENFDRYWLSCSLTEAWRRWHMSFSFILRDYFFIPLVRRGWNVVLALMITFAVCGLMHNLAPTFVLWGIVMGGMVAINQRWSRWMRTLDRQPHRALSAVRRHWMRLQPLPRLCAWFLTMNCLCGSALVIMNDRNIHGWRVIWEIVRRPTAAVLNLFGVEWQGIP